jgi:hypothetical protein
MSVSALSCLDESEAGKVRGLHIDATRTPAWTCKLHPQPHTSSAPTLLQMMADGNMLRADAS